MTELAVRKNKDIDKYIQLLKEGKREHSALAEVNRKWSAANPVFLVLCILTFVVCGVGGGVVMHGWTNNLSMSISAGMVSYCSTILAFSFGTSHFCITQDKVNAALSLKEQQEVKALIDSNEKKYTLHGEYEKDPDLFLAKYFEHPNYELKLKIKKGIDAAEDEANYLLEITNPESPRYKELMNSLKPSQGHKL